MKKKIVCCILFVAIIASLLPMASAHENQKQHDNDLKKALFGSEGKQLQGDEKTAFQAIADAAAICIDQFSPNSTVQWKNGDYQNLQDELGRLGLPALSIDFKDIDLNKDVAGIGENVVANTPRQYTHKGWKYKKYPNKEFWERRKQVLLETVNRVLFNSDTPLAKIPWISDILYSPNEQCDAFCAFVYYVHILGDHIEGDDPKKVTDIEPLIQYTDLSIPGIIPEMKECLQVIFASQKSGWSFYSLMGELSDLGIDAEKNCGMWGAVDTVEKCQVNQKYAGQLLVILAKYVPEMLNNEAFFNHRFK